MISGSLRVLPRASRYSAKRIVALRWFESSAAAVEEETPPTKVAEPNELERNLRPSEVVAGLDRHIVGQNDAKRAVAIAMRNRWRRKQLPEDLRKEVTPRNVLLVGPTGCGKTEVARRMAKLNDAPFIKVEATSTLFLWISGFKLNEQSLVYETGCYSIFICLLIYRVYGGRISRARCRSDHSRSYGHIHATDSKIVDGKVA
jgi:hypothetical protein